MYCTIADIEKILPPSVTMGDTNIGTPNPGRPQASSKNVVTPDQMIYYIGYAQQEVDSRLNPFYACPLRQTKTHEVEPTNNISSGQNIRINIPFPYIFTKYDVVRVQDDSKNERTTVTNVYADYITVDKLNADYDVSESLVSVLRFPDPVPFITARLAVSYAFDRLFVAEQEPDVSNYGKEMRRLAQNDLDNILTGTIFLVGQEHTGRRFLRGSLYDGYKSPQADFQFGRENTGG